MISELLFTWKSKLGIVVFIIAWTGNWYESLIWFFFCPQLIDVFQLGPLVELPLNFLLRFSKGTKQANNGDFLKSACKPRTTKNPKVIINMCIFKANFLEKEAFKRMEFLVVRSHTHAFFLFFCVWKTHVNNYFWVLCCPRFAGAFQKVSIICLLCPFAEPQQKI